MCVDVFKMCVCLDVFKMLLSTAMRLIACVCVCVDVLKMLIACVCVCVDVFKMLLSTAMRLIAGESLDEWVAARRGMSLRDLAAATAADPMVP